MRRRAGWNTAATARLAAATTRGGDLLPHADWIKDEVLAVALDTDASAVEPIIVKA